MKNKIYEMKPQCMRSTVDYIRYYRRKDQST